MASFSGRENGPIPMQEGWPGMSRGRASGRNLYCRVMDSQRGVATGVPATTWRSSCVNHMGVSGHDAEWVLGSRDWSVRDTVNKGGCYLPQCACLGYQTPWLRDIKRA